MRAPSPRPAPGSHPVAGAGWEPLLSCQSCQSCGRFGSERNHLSQDGGEPGPPGPQPQPQPQSGRSSPLGLYGCDRGRV